MEKSNLRVGVCHVPTDITAVSHVMALDAIDGWQWMPSMVGNGCHRWLAMDAIDGWQWMPMMVGNACQRWLANHVISESIYSPHSSHR